MCGRVGRGPGAWPHRGMAVSNRRHSGSQDLGETEGSPDDTLWRRTVGIFMLLVKVEPAPVGHKETDFICRHQETETTTQRTNALERCAVSCPLN